MSGIFDRPATPETNPGPSPQEQDLANAIDALNSDIQQLDSPTADLSQHLLLSNKFAGILVLLSQDGISATLTEEFSKSLLTFWKKLGNDNHKQGMSTVLNTYYFHTLYELKANKLSTQLSPTPAPSS